MRIIVINAKSDFSPEQQATLESLGQVCFVESNPNFTNTIFTDNVEKVLALGPEVIDWKISNKVIEKIPHLKAICLPTTSFSWIDGEFLRAKGITLTNVPKYSTESVAEYAIWMMLAVARKIPLLIKNKWQLDYSNHKGVEARGKVMGIVGLGSIGTRIAEIGQAMGMDVVYWSRSTRDERFKYTELEELLAQSDFVFPTLVKNAGTTNLLDSDKLKLLKTGASIVSITGDELFDLKYAVSRLGTGDIAGIAFESEKTTMENYQGNILVTPPVAWYTKEAATEDMRIWIESVRACIKNEPINIVN